MTSLAKLFALRINVGSSARKKEMAFNAFHLKARQDVDLCGSEWNEVRTAIAMGTMIKYRAAYSIKNRQ